MDARSLLALQGVEPNLVKVITHAYGNGTLFEVIHGLRTREEEQKLVAGRHSTTEHSRHLPDKSGLAAAVDVVALEKGHISWDPNLYSAIANTIKASAHYLQVSVEWGGDWLTFKDLGHFQLPWKEYP